MLDESCIESQPVDAKQTPLLVRFFAPGPTVWSAFLVVIYLMFGPAEASTPGQPSTFGVSKACADGTCHPMTGDICNVGGGDNQNYCRAGDDGCYI